MTEPKELNTVTTVNFAEKKAIDRWNVEADKGVGRFLRDIAKISKEHDLKSVLVLTVDGKDHVEWLHLMESDHHKALTCLALEDAFGDLKAELFNEYLDEE